MGSVRGRWVMVRGKRGGGGGGERGNGEGKEGRRGWGGVYCAGLNCFNNLSIMSFLMFLIRAPVKQLIDAAIQS